MEFVNPYFLFGLLALSIPIIIHLFNFRRFKRVYFTNVQFLKEVKVQTKKQSKLRHLLVLILRMLAIVCLVLAFAQPYIPLGNHQVKQGVKHKVSIYVDNSFSMETRGEKGTLIEEAKNKACEILNAYKPSDVFQLLTNDFEGRHQHFVSKEEFLTLLNEVKPSPAIQPLSKVTARQHDLFATDPSGQNDAFLLSDFQKSTADMGGMRKDTLARFCFVPLEASQKSNLYVDSCWFASPVHLIENEERITISIKNASEQDFEKIPVKLMLNGQQRAIASFDVKGGQTTDVTLSFTNHETGIQQGILEITDYPVTFDDRFYFSYSITPKIPVICINGDGESSFLNALMQGDTAIAFRNVPEKNIDFSSLPGNHLVILNQLKEVSSGLSQTLISFLQNGGSLVVIPTQKQDIKSWQSFLTSVQTDYFTSADTSGRKVTAVNFQHPVYRNVFEQIPENIDLPRVFFHYRLSRNTRSTREDLMTMDDGNAFCSSYRFGKGKIYLFASPLEPQFTSLPRHAMFVPTLYNMALLSQPEEKLFYTIENNAVVELPLCSFKGEQVFRIRNAEGNFEFIPEVRTIGEQVVLLPHGQITTAGNYTVLSDGTKICGVSFNYDRRESNMTILSSSEIEDQLKKAGSGNFFLLKVKEKPIVQAITELNRGISLWKTFVILALIFLAGEVALLRFWK